ncbi:Putative disintegrin and metalloproteinase domain-containing protein 5 [Heterocephalus glaber]|uniref:Putative disintegrin and metalloproteinase domain-containing protein 5 n=1 Tax=Heterocephalus glaber TaxID=10181 RepID=G5B7E5_HETGA|nr:Putative disintegrin and metalloproteinase domain-containing protein 5 [Heterocephalus glaber]
MFLLVVLLTGVGGLYAGHNHFYLQLLLFIHMTKTAPNILSLCYLRGVMRIENISYGIEPLEAVSGFMHMIYEENNDDTHVSLFGENDTFTWLNNTENQVRSSLHKTEFTKLFPRYIEMYIVVDKNLNCTHVRCCDPTSCKKKGSVKCGSGECCTTNCQLKKANTLCRSSIDTECDFNEYCNGNEGDCVPDTYARDGSHCDSGEGYCFGGICRTFDRQCEALFGKGSKGAPFACFDEINSRGDRFGNCGRYHCEIQHALCGKLVCTWPHKTLISRENLSVIYTHVRDDICVAGAKTDGKIIRTTSFTTYLEPTDRDETFVEDGTICGPGMICNNFQNCHCNKGFSPLECQLKKGEFGSIDDGHMTKG